MSETRIDPVFRENVKSGPAVAVDVTMTVAETGFVDDILEWRISALGYAADKLSDVQVDTLVERLLNT